MKAFAFNGLPGRVVFGAGALDGIGDEIDRLGARRVLVLSTPRQRPAAEEVARRLGARAAGIYAGAAMHVPATVAGEARAVAAELAADGCVAIGGGSTIGLAKAIAVGPAAQAIAILAVPTTFSGSEMTPIFGITAGGRKTTGRDARALPRTVLYDPRLLLALPVRVAGPSGMNAMAHCLEALYAPDGNPIASLMAEEGIRTLAASLPVIAQKPDDLAARGDALTGAWLAGACLAQVGMGIHHKICHVLGGSFNLPHAETHAIVLPHAAHYNRAAAPEAMAHAARALGDDDVPGALFDLARAAGAPAALRDIGMTPGGLAAAAKLCTDDPYPNPRPPTTEGVLALLTAAFEGRRPGA